MNESATAAGVAARKRPPELAAAQDVRNSELFRRVHAYFAATLAPGENQPADAEDLTASPDGRYAACTAIIHPSLDEAPLTRICIIDIGSGARRILDSSGNDRLPRWSADGRLLAFLSDRMTPGFPQVYIGDTDGANAEPAGVRTDGVVESIHWHASGRMLLLAVAGSGADVAGYQGGGKTPASKRAGLPAWLPSIESKDAENLWRRLFTYDLGTGALRLLSPPGVNCWECAWLGERRVAAVVSDSHSEGSWYSARLIAIDLDDGAVRQIYESRDQIGVPAASPSGDRVALIDAVCSDRYIVAGELLVIDAQTGAVRKLSTGGVDVTDIAWRGESHVVYAGHRGLETVIGESHVDSGDHLEHYAGTERTFGGPWYPHLCAMPGGGCLAVAEAYATAPEIAHLREGDYRVLSSFASSASLADGFHSARVEPVHWRGRDGLELSGWLVKPNGDGPFPLVADIHGGPVWACRNRWHGRLRGAKVLTDHGIAVFYPNPRGSGGRGREFARRVIGDMGGEDAFDILAGIDALVARRIADGERVGTTGISYGGFMSAWIITQTTRFAAAVPISPVANWYSQHHTSQIPYFDRMFLAARPDEPGQYFDRSPAMQARAVKTPALILTGGLDQNTPPTQALEFHRALLEQGVESVLAIYPTAGHGIRTYPPVLDATTRYVCWFLHYLGAGC